MDDLTTIYFDMDGTLANLYQIADWLEKLRAYDPSPYLEAETMVDMRTLARTLNRLQSKGYRIGVISWTSMVSTPEYDEATRIAKVRWLNKHLRSVAWNEVHIVEYGTPKESFISSEYAILFDDNEKVRESWTGMAYTEKEILDILKKLL